MDTQTVYECDSCGDITENEDELETLYECGNCGTRFIRSNSYTGDNHQCPDCLKFASKVSENGCPQCGDGECEGVEKVNVDGDWLDPDDAAELEQEQIEADMSVADKLADSPDADEDAPDIAFSSKEKFDEFKEAEQDAKIASIDTTGLDPNDPIVKAIRMQQARIRKTQ